MLTGLLFLGSCQELEQVEPLVEESIDTSFDRAKFLNAVNLAAGKYIANSNNDYTSLNFRRVENLEEQGIQFMNDIASEFNNENHWFNAYSSTNFDQIWNNSNHTYLSKKDLPSPVKKHIEDFESVVDKIAFDYEQGNYHNEDELISRLKSELTRKGNQISGDNNISLDVRLGISETFFLLNETFDDLGSMLKAEELENGFVNFKNRWVRAIVRTIIFVAVTTAVIYSAGTLLTSMKLGSIISGHKVGVSLIKNGITLSNGLKLYSFKYSIGFGIIYAGKSWDKSWKGLPQELTFGVKLSQ
ncbi:hypothetical protein GCM10008106_19690 [Mongoliitalea lutea]|uniref:Uncharacterized protein n=2 Tax=Mongoliitalea lutea TaxID=849756 RepID=A0A8J3CXG4_9BACT|nr:hypothetical protein GCM10008106_19690 [Mongoliitalea lutea]